MPLTGVGTQKRQDFRRADKNTGFRLFLVLVAVSGALIFASVRDTGTGPLSKIRHAAMVITSPFEYVSGLITRPIEAASNVVSNLTADQETLSELREENRRLRARNVELEEEAASASRFEALLDLKSSYDLTSTGARVTSGSNDTWADTIVIDKGSSAGLAVGMPVTDSQAVIGQIIECGATSSVVRLISDENSSVSAMVQSSRAQGMLRGSADGSLHLTLIRADQTIVVGDSIITSGLGGVYPKGLLLGRVASVERAPGALYYDVIVERYSSIESFEEVLVITSIKDEQQASAEDIQEADGQDTEGLMGDNVTSAQTETTDAAQDGTDSDDEQDAQW